MVKPKVVVVMPAYNAQKTIEKTWREVVAHDVVDLVIVVDAASQDDTLAMARRLDRVMAHAHPRNLGYGANQKTCYQLALSEGADIVIMVHPDYQYTPKLIPAMAGLVSSGLYSCVLASRILGLNLARLSADWQVAHGHGLLLAETFIDPGRFAGTCYRAANWIELGHTRGFAKSNQTYIEHGTVKRIWVFRLHRQAQRILSQALPHPQLPRLEIKTMTITEADAAALFSRLDQMEDPRARRGRRHTQRSLLAIILCAVISGAQGSNAISEWVNRLTPLMLRRLRCRRAADGSYDPPSEPTIRRLLAAVNIEQLERQLGDWLQTQAVSDEPVALDGKTLRGSHHQGRARQLVAAFGHHSNVVMNQVEVADKASEIKAVKPLLDALPLAGRVVTADALHTQVETARYLVEDKKAHYLFTVKDNQPTLKADIASLQMEALPPCA